MRSTDLDKWLSRPPALQHLMVFSMLLSLLAGCGGGGGGSGPTAGSGGNAGGSPPVASYPESGAYSWTFTESFPGNGINSGLSFGHPSTPSVSYVVQPTSFNISDALEVDQGTVDAATGAVSGITPWMLVYIMNGQIQAASLVANGSAPRSVTASSFTDGIFYCSFAVRNIDYANPANSRFSVTTAGPDGACGTSDDGAAILVFDSSSNLSEQTYFSAGNPLIPLAPLRSPGNYKPIGWFDEQGLDQTDPSSDEYITYPLNSNVQLVDSTPFAILANVNITTLTVVTYTSTGAMPTSVSVPVPSCNTWVGLGHDSSNFYAYCNSKAPAPANYDVSNYALYQIPFSGTSASLVTSGSGSFIRQGSLGLFSAYLILEDDTQGIASIYNSYTAVALNKKTFAATTLSSDSVAFYETVLTTNSGTDFLWQSGQQNASSSITVLGSGLQTVASFPNAFPNAYLNPTELNLNISQNASQLLILSPFTNGPYATAGSSLINFNTATGISTSIGNVPPDSEFAGYPVIFKTISDPPSIASFSEDPRQFTLLGGGNPDLLLGFGVASGSPAAQYSEALATLKVFSYQPNVASSLKATASMEPAQ